MGDHCGAGWKILTDKQNNNRLQQMKAKDRTGKSARAYSQTVMKECMMNVRVDGKHEIHGVKTYKVHPCSHNNQIRLR